jgi:hypothetical protein
VALTPEQERLFVIELEKKGETQVRSDSEHAKYRQHLYISHPHGSPEKNAKPKSVKKPPRLSKSN